MRPKFFVLTAAVALAVIMLGACVSVQPPTQTPTRTLSVNGSAQINLPPDIAYISIGVHTENANAKEAVSANNTQAQKIQDAIKALGVDAKDLLTTNFSIYPQQQYDLAGKPTGTIFVVDNTVHVTLRNLDKIGEILQAAVDAGANNIYGIQFDIADKTAALSDGRAAAVANARTQAEELAKAAGVTLGAVQSINFYNSYPVPVSIDDKGGMAMVKAAVPISAGQLTITVDVNIVYEIH